LFPKSPQFDKKNVYGHYSIKTAREREFENSLKSNKRYAFGNGNEADNQIYYTPRDGNKFTQTLIHPSNEIFETKLKEKPKGGVGSSIMSGEINKVNRLRIKTYDQEKIPYAGSSIDISQPDIYRYEVNQSLSRNNPLAQSVKSFENHHGLMTQNPLRYTIDPNQSFSKSRNMTMSKRINSMERILDWKPKELHRLNLINDRKNIFMEKSLKNTIPYKQHDIGKLCLFLRLIYRTQAIRSSKPYENGGVLPKVPVDRCSKERVQAAKSKPIKALLLGPSINENLQL
jgi:hypothetical protein